MGVGDILVRQPADLSEVETENDAERVPEGLAVAITECFLVSNLSGSEVADCLTRLDAR